MIKSIGTTYYSWKYKSYVFDLFLNKLHLKYTKFKSLKVDTHPNYELNTNWKSNFRILYFKNSEFVSLK